MTSATTRTLGITSHDGFRTPDPFAPRQKPAASLLNSLLATALFRCWNIIIFFTAWATVVTVLNHRGSGVSIKPTLLTVIGTVLGFVISYRTTSSFEMYNEGRRLWSKMISASRTFARLTWFHVPMPLAIEGTSTDELKARTLVEKVTVINLIEAFAVSVKHYLRGEDGIDYDDLYHLMKFIPVYDLPAGRPSIDDNYLSEDRDATLSSRTMNSHSFGPDSSLPLHYTSRRASTKRRDNGVSSSFGPPTTPMLDSSNSAGTDANLESPNYRLSPTESDSKEVYNHVEEVPRTRRKSSLSRDPPLQPSSNPPSYHLFDVFPFSLLNLWLVKRGKEGKGKTAAKKAARRRHVTVSHNIPLEISFYLSSYISALQSRGQIDGVIAGAYVNVLDQLVECLTGFERILTTPIPFSYSMHLWLVTIVYVFFLPLQVWNDLNWLTIPATSLASFVFFGFLVAAEEIENPFGYDKNDLNLDHFTNNIIRNELLAITSAPLPELSEWAFSPLNDTLFTRDARNERLSPEEWVRRGYGEMQKALRKSSVARRNTV